MPRLESKKSFALSVFCDSFGTPFLSNFAILLCSSLPFLGVTSVSVSPRSRAMILI